MPSSGPQRSKFDEFSISLKGSANLLLLTQRLRSTYKEFKSVESLAFICDDSMNARGPQCLDYMEPQMLWMTWGANLRELNISVKGSIALPFILPPEGCHIQLPRLEIMRFAYLQNYSSDAHFEGPAISVIAQLYASATATLHTLELRFDLYAQHTPPISETLLPHGVVFSKLNHFAFKPKRHYGWKVANGLANITRFVRDHSSTIRKLQLGDLSSIFDSLVTDTPPAFLNHVDNAAPPIALSIRAAQNAHILDPAIPTIDGDSLTILRQCIIALNMHDVLNHDWSYISLLSNLRKLSLTWGGYVNLASFAKVARYAPRILSLSVRHSSRDHRLRAGLEGDNQQPGEHPRPHMLTCCNFCITLVILDVLDALRQWTLKDIGFYKGFNDFRPTWWYMQHMATLTPSIESFFGRGHMEESLGKPWEQSWVWRKNKYVDYPVLV